MNTLVIKSWHASEIPDENGNYVHIAGRTDGLISWIFNLIGISPTVELKVSVGKISFVENSWAGLFECHTPLENVCTTFYGYIKPWKEAFILGVVVGFVIFMPVAISGILAGIFVGILVGILVGIIYYSLNKTLKVGFCDIGGDSREIKFKRSIIEGHNIDEQAAAGVCRLIQAKLQGFSAPQHLNRPPPPPPRSQSSAASVPPPPATTSTKYYYADAQSQPKGPVDYAELLALEKSGELKPDTKVIVEGGAAWRYMD